MTPRLFLLALGLLLAVPTSAQPLRPSSPVARPSMAEVLQRPFARPSATPVPTPHAAAAGTSGTGPVWARAAGSGYAGPAARTVATAVAADGAVYSLGQALRPGSGPAVFLAKHSAAGDELWRVWHEPTPTTALTAAALVLDAAGHPVTVVSEDRFDIDVPIARDVLVRRYSAAGTPEWLTRYSGEHRVSLVTAAAAGAGGTYVAGATYPTLDDPYPDPFVIRVTPEGQLAWAAVVEGGSAGEVGTWAPGFFDVAALPDGGAVAVGAVEASELPPLQGGSRGSAFAAYRFTASGTVDVGSTLQPGGVEATATAVATDAEGNAVVAGFAANSLLGHTPLLVRYTTSTSPTVWEGAPTPDARIPSEVRLAADGTVYVAGATWGPDLPQSAYLDRHDAVDAPVWTRVTSRLALFGEQQRPVRLVLTDAGPVLARSTDEGDFVMVSVDAYNAAGATRWSAPVAEADGPVVAMSLAARPGGGVVVGSFAADGGGTAAHAVALSAAAARDWTATFTGGSRDSDTGVTLAPDARGGVVVAGRADGSRNSAVALASYDADGAARWTRTLASDVLDFPDDHALLPGPDAGTYLVLSGLIPEPDGARTQVARLSADGETVWTVTLLGRHGRIAPAPDGGLFVARGYSYAVGEGWETDVRLARLTPAGTTAWETKLDVSDPFVAGLAADGAGGAYVLYEADPLAPTAGPTLVRVGPAGDVLWTATRPLPERLSGLWRTVAVAPDGDAVTLTCDGTEVDPCAVPRLVRFAAATGAVRGVAALPGFGEGRVTVGPDGRAYIVGSGFDGATGAVEIRAAAVAADGSVAWTRTHPAGDELFPVGAAATPDALYGLFLGGLPFSGTEPVLVHLDPANGDLDLLLVGGVELPGQALPVGLTVGAEGVPYATGTLVTATGSQVLALRYPAAQPTGADPDAPAPALGLAAAPNPARDHARLTASLPHAAPVRVDVYDVLGRRVATAHDGPLAAGAHALDVPLGGLAPGAYVVRLTTPDASVTARLTVVR